LSGASRTKKQKAFPQFAETPFFHDLKKLFVFHDLKNFFYDFYKFFVQYNFFV